MNDTQFFLQRSQSLLGDICVETNIMYCWKKCHKRGKCKMEKRLYNNNWFKSEPQGSMFTLSPSSPLLRLLPLCFKCLFLSPIFLQVFTQEPTPPWSLHPIKRHPIPPLFFTHVNLTQSLLGNPYSLFVNLSIMLLWGHREMPKI